MPDAIKIESLSKKYIIGHQTKERYTNFRDVITDGAKNFGVNVLATLAGKKLPNRGSYTEDFWALKDINFDVRSGEVVGIIGKNGAGKSTILKILSRITDPTEGRIVINGSVVSLLEVGTGFHPELTGRENIYLNGALLGMSRTETAAKFDEIVEFSEVEEFLDTPVKRYSSGMYMRLAFAVAAHLETEIMIIDEVLAVGDISFQRKCLGKMEGASKLGRTIIFVSHNLAAVQSLCSRVVFIDKGRVKFDGNPADAIRAYLSAQTGNDAEFTRGFYLDRSKLENVQTSEFRFSSCELINPGEIEIGPRTGDPLIVRMQYEAVGKWQAPAFVVRIKDVYGYEVIRLSTMPISGMEIERLYPNGQIQLTIDFLPLVAGSYYLDIGFVRERVRWIAELEDVIKFNVSEQDVYGSGFALDRSRGVVVAPHGWEHISIG